MNFYDRLKIEEKELREKFNKLSDILDIFDNNNEISKYQENLLGIQLDFMKGYLNILVLRIEDLENDD